MWNLPPRQPLLASDPTAFSLAEDLRARAYALQAIGGRLDDVLLRVVRGDFLAAHVLRILLDELSAATATSWEALWVPVSVSRLALLCSSQERTVRKDVDDIVERGVVVRRRRGQAGGGTITEVACDMRRLARVLDGATWRYLYECFPDAIRPELPDDLMEEIRTEMGLGKCDMVSHSRTACSGRSSISGKSLAEREIQKEL